MTDFSLHRQRRPGLARRIVATVRAWRAERRQIREIERLGATSDHLLDDVGLGKRSADLASHRAAIQVQLFALGHRKE